MTETEVSPTTETVLSPPLSGEVPKSAPPKGGWECGGGERWPETPEAANQRIRLAELISQGQYLQAISQLDHDYTSLVETMPSIIFMLRCRYFIELVGRLTSKVYLIPHLRRVHTYGYLALVTFTRSCVIVVFIIIVQAYTRHNCQLNYWNSESDILADSCEIWFATCVIYLWLV